MHEASAEEVHAAHQSRLKFAARHFSELLRTGEKLFVFQLPGRISRPQAQAVLTQLQRYGPNALLYVDTEHGLPSGAVEQLGYGLWHGRLDRMAPPGHASDVDILGWLSVCTNAWLLWRRMHGD
jgi:hypothetical protein